MCLEVKRGFPSFAYTKVASAAGTEGRIPAPAQTGGRVVKYGWDLLETYSQQRDNLSLLEHVAAICRNGHPWH